MNIDAVIKKQTEILQHETFVNPARAKQLVLETVNEVLKSIKEEALDRLDELIEEGKRR